MAERNSMSVGVIGIVANVFKPEALELVDVLVSTAGERGMNVVFDEPTGHHRVEAGHAIPPDVIVCSDEALADKADVLLVLGGDGTILSATKRFSPLNLPVTGVNLGKLGFLAEVGPGEIESALDQLHAGRWSIERRLMLEAVVCKRDGSESRQYRALNDFVIAREAFARVIEVQLSVDDRLVNMYTGDGLIVATPTGSTGYSLSAGGPVVFPLLHSILVTPICPHTIGSRPLVLSDAQTVSARVRSARAEVEIGLTIDGQYTTQLEEGDTLVVTRSPFPAQLVALEAKNFFEILHTKLKGRLQSRLK